MANKLNRTTLNTRSSNMTCSIGIGRVINRSKWDVTVYNVPQISRQDVNIIATLKNAPMSKGTNITIDTPASAITIHQIDDTPVFGYNEPELKAPLTDPKNGITKVKLGFTVEGGKEWDTGDCGAGNAIFAAGRESWSCDFGCVVGAGDGDEAAGGGYAGKARSEI